MDETYNKLIEKISSLRATMARSFLRLSIASKMLLGYVPLALLMLVVTVLSLGSLDRMLDINRKILKVDIVVIDTADRLIESLLAQELNATRYSIIRSPEMLELYYARRNDFDAQLKQLDAIKGVDYVDYKAIDKVHDQYNAALTWGFRLDADAARIAVETGKIKPAQDELVDMLKTIANRAREDQNERTLSTTNLGDSMFLYMAVLCFVGLIFGVTAAALITRNISSAVLKINKATNQIAEGDFNATADISNQDELGDLSNSFSNMAGRLRTLEEMYMDASPLTHLPGGVAVENVLKKRIEGSEHLSLCMLDLDNFKALNDHHGYAIGNKVIKASSSIIEEAVRQFGNENDFVGHIGGDDFIVLTTPEKHTSICKYVIWEFDQKIKDFYEPDEVSKGFFMGKTRQGEPAQFPLVTISIAVVTSINHRLDNHIHAGEIAAELKEYAKSIDGSVYVVDRRRRDNRQDERKVERRDNRKKAQKVQGSDTRKGERRAVQVDKT